MDWFIKNTWCRTHIKHFVMLCCLCYSHLKNWSFYWSVKIVGSQLSGVHTVNSLMEAAPRLDWRQSPPRASKPPHAPASSCPSERPRPGSNTTGSLGCARASQKWNYPDMLRCAWLFSLTLFLAVICVLSILLLMDVWVVSSFGLLWMLLV